MTSLTRRQALAAAASTTALAACASRPAAAPLAAAAPPTAVPPSAANESNASALLDSIAENFLRFSPESATSLGIDKEERAALRSRLSDRSAAGQRLIRETLRYDLGRAELLPQEGLSHPTRTSLEVVKSAYRTALEGFALPYGDVAVGGWRNTPYVVIQNVGAYLDIPRFLDSEHQVKTAADAESWLQRLARYPSVLDGELERMRSARALGLIPPSFLIDKALEQLNASSTGVSLARLAASKLDPYPGLTRRASEIIAGQVRPALLRQIDELKAQRALATEDAGMWARPGGEDYYRWVLKASTTTAMSPDEIHQLGIDTLRTLHAQMDPILRSLGYTQGSVGERMLAIGKDPRFLFPNNDQGRAQVLAFIQERIAIIRGKMPQAFRTLVRGNVEVRRLPPEEEPGAPGAYGGAGSIDGSIPGKFWINLKDGFDHNRMSLPTLTHHEAIPGHVWEGEYSQKLPLIRSLLSFGAFSEGWALYAEQLADELGVYDGDPAGRLGYLDSIAFRACRLVVDTGLHHKRWTREQARAYFLAQVGNENASEVDRYCSWPGQATSYEVGHQAINRERERAKAALGPAYDLRDFNSAVVAGGNVPMDVLAQNVAQYVREKSAGA
jgi:uncharacterized protein (DUF885 family)